MDFETPTIVLFGQGLGHSDRQVREECLRYLSQHPESSQSNGREALTQLGIHGPGVFEFAHQVASLPLAGDDIPELAELCRRMLASGDAENAARYLRWLLKVETARLPEAKRALEAFAPEDFVLDHSFLALDVLEAEMDASIEMSRLSPDEAVERLNKLTNEMVDADTFPLGDWRACERIAARLSEPDGAETGSALAAEWLGLPCASDESGPNDYKLLAAVALAGRLRLVDTSGKLIELLAIDWDALNEQIERAFSRMNRPESLTRIGELWFDLPEHGRIYLSSPFEQLHPAGFDNFFEQVLADEEEDYFVQLRFAQALAHGGSRRQLDAAQAFLDQFHQEDPEVLAASGVLRAHYLLRGYRPELAAEIKVRLEAHEARVLQRQALFELPLPKQRPSQTLPKVGRNDPCPCGSGKKYKKCCL